MSEQYNEVVKQLKQVSLMAKDCVGCHEWTTPYMIHFPMIVYWFSEVYKKHEHEWDTYSGEDKRYYSWWHLNLQCDPYPDLRFRHARAEGDKTTKNYYMKRLSLPEELFIQMYGDPHNGWN